MKTNTLLLSTLALLPAPMLTPISCSSTSQPPPPVGSASFSYTRGVRGGVRVQTIHMAATVTAVDKAKRSATLPGLEGRPTGWLVDDIIHWLGPIEGLTGILMGGLSTGYFFVVVSHIHQSRHMKASAV